MSITNIRLQGVLVDPINSRPDAGALIKVTMLTNNGSSLRTSESEYIIGDDGEYDITIEYGTVKIEYKTALSTAKYTVLAVVNVNENTGASTLPQLVLDVGEPTSEALLAFEVLLQQANAAAASASSSEANAALSESSALNSANIASAAESVVVAIKDVSTDNAVSAAASAASALDSKNIAISNAAIATEAAELLSDVAQRTAYLLWTQVAVGGETVIRPSYAFLAVASVHVNGRYLTPVTEFTYDPAVDATSVILITPLLAGETVVVSVGVSPAVAVAVTNGGSLVGDTLPLNPLEGTRFKHCVTSKTYMFENGVWVEDRPSIGFIPHNEDDTRNTGDAHITSAIKNGDGSSAQDTHDATKAILIAQGLSGNYGFFEKGFAYINVGDVGIATDGKIYTYVGAGAPVKSVAAGVNPSGNADYAIVKLNTSYNDILTWGAITGDKNQANTIHTAIAAGVKFSIPEKISCLNEVFARWSAGDKYPVAFFGDSTFDGATTTIDGTNPATAFNRDKLVSGNVPDGFNVDHDDSEVPNAYPNILQRLSRQYIKTNTVLRVYNAGYRSQRMDNGWATNNVFNAVYGNAAYSDLKVIVIGFGLNDINASGANLTKLATDTKNYLEALILDAYARGVQPVIATNVVTSYASAPYPNVDVTSVVDNVRVSLAKKYGLDIIDLAKAQLDYTYYNGQSENYWTISSDSLHLNDRGTMLQAQYTFKEMAGKMVMCLSKGDNYIDLTHPAMRLKGNDGINLSKATGLNRGLNQRYRSLTVTASYYTDMAGSDVCDLWVWNDKPDSCLVYCKFLDELINPSNVANKSNLPQLNISSDFGSINNTYADESNYLDPNFIGGPSGGARAVTETFVKNLRYGLNRVRMSIPSTIDTSFIVGSNVNIGFFKIETDNIENKKPTIAFTDNSVNAVNYSDFHDVISFRQSRYGLDSRSFVGYDNRNRYSLMKTGDFVEFNINASWIANSGVILGYNTYNNTSLTTPAKQKQSTIMASSYMALSSAGSLLRLKLYSPTGVQTLDLNPLSGGDEAFSSYIDKDLIIRLTLISNEQIKAEAFNSNFAQIGAGQSSPTTSQGLVFVRNMQSAYVGGLMSLPSSTSGMILNRLSYRVLNN